VDLGLKGRRALVTAASKGLGRACANALAAEGALVVISSRDGALLEKVAKDIGAHGWHPADMSVAGGPESAVEAAATALGGLDILVVNAGGPPAANFQGTSLENWDVAHQLTLMSAVRLIKSALPHLKQSDQGRIVIVTSISVRQPLSQLVLSNSVRAAVTGMAKTLSGEIGPDGITVNCLAPGAVLTDRIRNLAPAGVDIEKYIQTSAEAVPLRRMGDPAEFGATCAFLCSKQAGFITGQTIGVDGGTLVGVH
jgi:3-oxoacyl-[acyl-carrier protein] reductase